MNGAVHSFERPILPATAENLTAAGVAIEHHFGGGAYIKQTHIPAGTFLGQHTHEHDHLAVLVSGDVRLIVDDETTEHHGYRTFLFKGGRSHAVEALTDTVWLCIWATDETDPARIDSRILEG